MAAEIINATPTNAIDLDTVYREILKGKVQLTAPIARLRQSYLQAQPFPYFVLDNMFADHLLDALLAEMDRMSPQQWTSVDQDPRERTLRMRSAAEVGEAGAELTALFHSAPFLCLLSEITGIWQLLPDPYLQGSGYARMRRADYFAVHSDRSVAYDTGLVRRLVMIVFLNKDWKKSYHGELELWNHEGTKAVVSVEPLFNRTIFFEVASPNFHGVPTPLNCPADLMRQSFMVYYHTVGTGTNTAVKPHSSIFAPRLYGSNRMTWKPFVRDLAPPLLLRWVRRLLDPSR